jgi:hypothetical protein
MERDIEARQEDEAYNANLYNEKAMSPSDIQAGYEEYQKQADQNPVNKPLLKPVPVNQEFFYPEDNQELVNQPLDIPASPYTLQSALSYLRKGIDQLGKTTEKVTNPYAYVTSEQSKQLLLWVPGKFETINSEEELRKITTYTALGNDPERSTGNLLKKVDDRQYAFNAALNCFAQKVIRENDSITKTGHQTNLKTLIEFGKKYITPACNAKQSMILRICCPQDNNNNN